MGIVGNANGKAKKLLEQMNNDGLLLSFEMLIEQREQADSVEMMKNLNVARIWVIDELERRFPESIAEMEKWVENGGGGSYDQAFIDVVMKSLAKK